MIYEDDVCEFEFYDKFASISVDIKNQDSEFAIFIEYHEQLHQVYHVISSEQESLMIPEGKKLLIKIALKD